MYYYEVWVDSLAYRSKDNLTYHYALKINSGSIVSVELRKEIVNAVVVKIVSKPRFKTKKIKEVFKNIPTLPAHLIFLGKWILDYYQTSIGAVTKLIIPINIDSRVNDYVPDINDQSSYKAYSSKLPSLTMDQKIAVNKMKKNDSYLLYGITGSGKTRVYLELIKIALSEGKSTVLLVPEIGLTGQLKKILSDNFDKNIIIDWNSKQSSKNKSTNWINILTSKKPVIVFGPRSALFTPLKNIGLIIIDEAHETSYKQESSPYYETNRVAGYLANNLGIKLVLGSATPSIVDYFLAQKKDKNIIVMKSKALKSANQHKNIEIIDLKDKTNFKSSKYLSEQLIVSAKKSLSNNEQVLLYLNRRGTSRLIFCSNCGWQSLCPHCDVPLTYHGDSHELICHSCDYKNNPPLSCPNCSNLDIIYKSIGTKAIVDEVKRLFPKATYARFDSDNKKKERIENKYQDLLTNKINIIIGTQTVAKSFDLPKLSTLGVIIADTSLYIPDFTSNERTFQLLSQVIGRVGRGHISSKTIIQTFNPDNDIIKYALGEDYVSFFKHELSERKKYLFPPFCSILKITVSRKNKRDAISTLNSLRDLIENNFGCVVEGPTPSFRERIRDSYHWQLIVKSTVRTKLLGIIDILPANTNFDIDPVNLL